MSNPAVLLFNNLVAWNPPNVSQQTAPERMRGLATNRDHALRMHEIALGYIAQIRELLDTLEQATNFDVDEYRRELPNWTAMVLSFSNGWAQAAQFDANSLRWLKNLGPLLDNLVPEFSDERSAECAQGLTELLDILGKETTLNPELTVYILNLVNHMRWVLQDAKIQGSFALTRAATLLHASISTASEATTDVTLRSRYKDLLSIFKRRDTAMKAIEMTTAAAKAIDAVQKALPPGTFGT